MPHIYTVYLRVSLKVIQTVNNKHHQWKIYKLGTINMSSFLNQLIHELLGHIPNIILIILFWIKKTLCIVVEMPQNIILYLLTPLSRVLLRKLTGSQLIKKFPTFYGTRKFITAFTSAHHLSLWSMAIIFRLFLIHSL